MIHKPSHYTQLQYLMSNIGLIHALYISRISNAEITIINVIEKDVMHQACFYHLRGQKTREDY